MNRMWIDWDIETKKVPESQYYDICRHFGLTYGMEANNTVSATSIVDGDEIFTDGFTYPENELDNIQAASIVPDGGTVDSIESDTETVPEEVNIDESCSSEGTDERTYIDIEINNE